MAINNLDCSNDDFPVDMQHIAREQQKDAKMQKIIRSRKHEDVISSNRVDGVHVITFHGKVWVPESIQERLAKWYHNVQQHAGKNCMVNTIGQTFVWKGLATSVTDHVDTCDSCQRNKNTRIRRRTESYPSSQLCGTKSPGKRSPLTVAAPGKSVLSAKRRKS